MAEDKKDAIETYGMTEEEYKKIQEAKAKIPEWIERGKKFIYPELLEDWENCVKYRAEDLLHGGDLENALRLMELLDSGVPMAEAIEMFKEQGNSRYSGKMVKKILFIFSKRGPEFFESAANGQLTEEEKRAIEDKKRENMDLEELHLAQSAEEIGEDPYISQKETATRVDINEEYGNTLDAAIKTLEDYKARGESVYIDFNGHMLYSCDITVDGAYLEVVGKTKAEFEEEEATWREGCRQREEQEIDRLAMRKSQLINEIGALQIELSQIKSKMNTIESQIKSKQDELGKML